MNEKPLSETTTLQYIAVEGVIGAGKTSLAKLFCDKLNAKLVLEQFEENPFLENFYKDRKKFAFQTQMFFLISRYKQQQELNQGDLFTDAMVSDYMFSKDRIFAKLNLSSDEMSLYEALFPALARDIRKPDLVIYLQSDIDRLYYNIRKRKRKIESSLNKSYLEELSDAYNEFFFRYQESPLLIVNSSELDFVERGEDFDEIWRAVHRPDRGFIEYLNPASRRLFND